MNGNNDGISIFAELYSPLDIPSAQVCGKKINIPKTITDTIQAIILFNPITAFHHNSQYTA